MRKQRYTMKLDFPWSASETYRGTPHALVTELHLDTGVLHRSDLPAHLAGRTVDAAGNTPDFEKFGRRFLVDLLTFLNEKSSQKASLVGPRGAVLL